MILNDILSCFNDIIFSAGLKFCLYPILYILYKMKDFVLIIPMITEKPCFKISLILDTLDLMYKFTKRFS